MSAVEEFREAAALPAAAIGALRRELDPWYEDQFAERADGSFGDFWHPGPENEGTGRVAVSNAIVELSPLGSSVAQTTTDFMLQPCMLDFARSALGSTPVLDDVQLAAYPIVGEGGHASAAARTDADGAASELHVWHRDSHNTHGQLRGFHECCFPGCTDRRSHGLRTCPTKLAQAGGGPPPAKKAKGKGQHDG